MPRTRRLLPSRRLPAPDAIADRWCRVDWRDRAARRPVGEGRQDGLNYTAVFAGSHKNDFSPHEPLSPQATTALQTEVDRLYDIFVNQVGQMRGIDPDAVRATEAGCLRRTGGGSRPRRRSDAV